MMHERQPVPGQLPSLFALSSAVLSLFFATTIATDEFPAAYAWQAGSGVIALLLLVAAALFGTTGKSRNAVSALLLSASSFAAALLWLLQPPALGAAPGAAGFWLVALALALMMVASLQRCADLASLPSSVPAALFGLWLLYFWQLLTVACDVPRVLLPAPWLIAQSLLDHADTLSGDFLQTVVKAVLAGWLLGSGLGFAVAIAIDRTPFLQRGLLPLASLTSAVPLVGVAPIAVMWFGFDWPSKAAVVILMTFFPMLISTLAGLASAGKLERELMHSYAASYLRTLLDLRLPSALPFVVSALKVNATLALIGAIVAEFFGSPTHGLGFRISTEAGRMNMPLVWGAITVASVTGSIVYALLVRLERSVAFWHPSVRSAN